MSGHRAALDIEHLEIAIGVEQLPSPRPGRYTKRWPTGEHAASASSDLADGALDRGGPRTVEDMDRSHPHDGRSPHPKRPQSFIARAPFTDS